MSSLVVLVISLLVVFGPGWAVTRALGLRRLAAVGFAVPCSVAIITAAAELAHLVHIPWSPLVPLALTLLLVVAIGAVSFRRARRAARSSSRTANDPRHGRRAKTMPPPSLRDRVRHARRQLAHDPSAFFASRDGEHLALLAGLALGIGFLGTRMLRMMGSLNAVTQTYDGIFHLNAVRHVLRTGSASARTVGGLTSSPEDPYAYPAAWHQTASVIAQLAQGDVVRATDALLVALAAIAWPVGLVLLVRTCTRAGSLGLFATGVLSSVSLVFPFVPGSFGILLPFLLGMSMVPAGFTLLAQLMGAGRSSTSSSTLRPGQVAALLPFMAIALALSHPQAVVALAVLGLPVMLWASCARVSGMITRRDTAPAAALTVLVTLAALAFTLLVWPSLQPGTAAGAWPAIRSTDQAWGQVLSLMPARASTWWPMAVLMVAALAAVVLLTRSGWLVAAWSWAALLAVAALSMPDTEYRYLLTGPWYSDPNLVMVLPLVVAIPILAVGLEAVVRDLFRRKVIHRAPLAPLSAVSTTLAILALGVLTPPAFERHEAYSSLWQGDHLLSADERAVLEDLDGTVPPGDVIAANPWNGGALAYAIADRQVSEPFVAGYISPDAQVLDERITELTTDPEVCDAAARLGVHWVLDFGTQEMLEGIHHAPALTELRQRPGVAQVVERRGDAALLRLEPCTRTDGSIWS